jgi:hypothetical protein
MTTVVLSAMISYQWTDSAAAELLHEELALRVARQLDGSTPPPG